MRIWSLNLNLNHRNRLERSRSQMISPSMVMGLGLSHSLPMPTLIDVNLSVPTLGWQEFLDRFRWSQGQHLTAIGPTESGKTTLIKELLDKAYLDGTHPWQAVAATKPMDEVVDDFVPRGFHRLPEWSVADAEITP